MSKPDSASCRARIEGIDHVPVASVCALLTCFNRREQTVAGLQRLRLSADSAGLAVHAVLVDDGSTDGTATAVRAQFDWVTVLAGRDLYWNRGMRMAMEHALKQRSEAHLLWLNDDTLLDDDALQRLLATRRTVISQTGAEPIIVGCTRDARTGTFTYGGNRRGKGLHRFRFSDLHDPVRPMACDTMNGNVVLLPRAIVDQVGLLDPSFEHALGDLDYGLRAVAAGVPVYTSPGFVGTCNRNPVQGTFQDRSLGVRKKLRLMLHRKGLPWRSWYVFTRRHGGRAWPFFFIWPYFHVLTSCVSSRRANVP